MIPDKRKESRYLATFIFNRIVDKSQIKLQPVTYICVFSHSNKVDFIETGLISCTFFNK